MRPVQAFAILVAFVAVTPAQSRAAGPTVEQTMAFRPVQKDVEYEKPSKSEYEQCQVKVEREGKVSGWVVLGPSGQPLRRFIDTNGDNVVDQWRYYNRGLEVYRDIDTDFNNKVDESRWVNTAGSRWGHDDDEDGLIDSWKVLSAEEATRVAVSALISQDEKLFKTLLVDEDDVRKLGITETISKKIFEQIADPGKKLKQVVTSSKKLNKTSKWLRFDSSVPGTIPSDTGTASGDLMVYENAMAIIETDGEPVLMQFGEIVRVGDVWKLTQIPRPLEGNTIQITEGGLLMQPALVADNTATSAPTGDVTPEMQKLLEDLQKLDQNGPGPNATEAALTRYTSDRTAILTRLVSESRTAEQRAQWMRQIADGLARTVQTTGDEKSLKRLRDLEQQARRDGQESEVVGYVKYRRMLAEYSTAIRNPDAEKRRETQKAWLEDLKAFVEDYPKGDDAAEALLQLGISTEFSGKISEARKWYDRLVTDHADTPAGIRAAGAVKRLEMTGKPLEFSGRGLDGKTIDARDYRGKVVLVAYWATWCKPCTEDLPQLRDLYKKYKASGFEIIGVNIDLDENGVDAYLKQHNVTWPQIHSPGGMESDAAREFGIISLPTMFLVGKDGKVLARNAAVDDVAEALVEAYGEKK